MGERKFELNSILVMCVLGLGNSQTINVSNYVLCVGVCAISHVACSKCVTNVLLPSPSVFYATNEHTLL